MAYQTVFRRYELKYLLTLPQKETIMRAMEPYMALDDYGRTTIRNIYFDTPTYRLIRRSIEKPFYKEKLRVRSYEQAHPDSTVFVELKKKYDSIVYKRRISLFEHEAMQWLAQDIPLPRNSQIAREIEYFKGHYDMLFPAVFLSYEREAYYAKDGSDFRITFDDKILARCENVSLTAEVYGSSLLEEGMALMEIKCSGGIPLWLTHVLSRERIYRTAFSKYGVAYQKIITHALKPIFCIN